MARSFYSGREITGRVVSNYSINMARYISPNIIRYNGNALTGSTIYEGDDIRYCNNPREAFLAFLRLNNAIHIDGEIR